MENKSLIGDDLLPSPSPLGQLAFMHRAEKNHGWILIYPFFAAGTSLFGPEWLR